MKKCLAVIFLIVGLLSDTFSQESGKILLGGNFEFRLKESNSDIFDTNDLFYYTCDWNNDK